MRTSPAPWGRVAAVAAVVLAVGVGGALVASAGGPDRRGVPAIELDSGPTTPTAPTAPTAPPTTLPTGTPATPPALEPPPPPPPPPAAGGQPAPGSGTMRDGARVVPPAPVPAAPAPAVKDDDDDGDDDDGDDG